DSVFHADGSLAVPPIALCEVQGYVYAAKLAVARLANALGNERLSAELEEQVVGLRDNFEQTFWDDDLGFYALALDGFGRRRLCRVRVSNVGYCLYTGIVSLEHARELV